MFVPEGLECNAIPPHRNRIGGDFLETAGTGTKNKRHLSNKWNHTDTALLFSLFAFLVGAFLLSFPLQDICGRL